MGKILKDNVTYRKIIEFARYRKFVSYGILVQANGGSWGQNMSGALSQHLRKLIKIGAKKGYPVLSANVVSQKDMETGYLSEYALGEFINAAADAGYEIPEDHKSFLEKQREYLFNWAQNAPQNLVDFDEDGEEASVTTGSHLHENPPSGYNDKRFEWAKFYQEFAQKLLDYRHKREELMSAIHAIISKIDGIRDMNDRYPDGSSKPLEDICPFTVMALFNRRLTDSNRTSIANELAKFLEVSAPAPTSFDGIPLVNNQKSRFFGFASNRQPDDINKLWETFACAIEFADSNTEDARTKFMAAYDETTYVHCVGWNLTMGLYWIRPWHFATLENQSRDYIENRLRIRIKKQGHRRRCNADNYMEVVDALTELFQDPGSPVRSFPELSLAAYGDTSIEVEETDSDIEDSEDDAPAGGVDQPEQIEPYTVDNIMEDGCFMDRKAVEDILVRLAEKKNLILQGPPGTGKTWLAKRLAYALLGEKDGDRVQAVQFHPNLSYEDFVHGWRPVGEGKLELADGPFMEMIENANGDPNRDYVVVIEEINRGNPAQIFGEMLTLIEADKRNRNEALRLSHKKEPVFVPDNLHIVGTMNIADRSLALVDYALRRRFAFIDLKPQFNEPWANWLGEKFNFKPPVIEKIRSAMLALNKTINNDFGEQFEIGHSYVTPPQGTDIEDPEKWFRNVVETEIGKLLDEYWIDDREGSRKSKEAQDALLRDF